MGHPGCMQQLPAPLRAALGLAATVVQEPRKIADKALELPMLAISSVLQASLRAQQQYAALTVAGDEVLTRMRGGAPASPPDWARFDDEPANPVNLAEQFEGEKSESEPTKAEPTKKAPNQKAPNQKAPNQKATARTPAASRTTARPVAKPLIQSLTKPATAAAKVASKAPKTVSAPRKGKSSAFDLVGEPGRPDDPIGGPPRRAVPGPADRRVDGPLPE